MLRVRPKKDRQTDTHTHTHTHTRENQDLNAVQILFFDERSSNRSFNTDSMERQNYLNSSYSNGDNHGTLYSWKMVKQRSEDDKSEVSLCIHVSELYQKLFYIC